MRLGWIRRPVRRYWLALTAVCLFTSLGLVLLGATLLARGEMQPVSELPARYLPGKSLPGDATCAWLTFRRNSTVSCYAHEDDLSIYLLYDAGRQIITMTTLNIGDETIGGLMETWGPPTGIQPLSWGVRIHWGNRYVYTGETPFVPSNTTRYVTYILDPEKLSPWRGFTAYEP